MLAAVRLRYLLLTIETFAVFVPRYLRSGGNYPAGEWLFFKTGAFTLTHTGPHFAGSALHLYADNPQLQIGPPPLVVLSVLQHYLGPAGATLVAAVAMALAGVVVVATLERVAVAVRGNSARVQPTTLLGGAVVVALWADSAALWRHLDDVMALTAIALATLLVARGRRWWLAAALLGLAAAAKPWAILAAPLLLGLPRQRRAPAVVVLLVSAGVWWAPFVLAAPGSVGALGGLHVVPDLGSVPHLLGLRGDTSQWLRPVQFCGGIVAGVIAAQRRSYLAVPIVALALRVASDPYVYSYYGLAPLMVGLGLDLLRVRRPVPYCTLSTAFVFFALPLFAPPTLCAVARLFWCVALVAAVVRIAPHPRRDDSRPGGRFALPSIA